MPVTLQDWIVYAIVLGVLWWLVRRFVVSLRSRGGCGGGCKCARDTVRRDPVIRRYLRRREKEDRN